MSLRCIFRPGAPARRPGAERRWIAPAILATALLAGAVLAPRPGLGQGAPLPPGEGRDKVQFHCSICHDLAIVRQQRLPRRVWDEVLTDMRTFGAVFDDAERDVILDYLTENLGPQ